MHRIAEGWAQVEVVAGETVLFSGRVVFTDADNEFELIDPDGIPFIIDKWGLIQRPFEVRAPGIVGALADESLRILDVLRTSCGIEGWISFGTLLGAVRQGTAIGHDSDVDLCYTSEKETPAEMAAELAGIGRALRRAGLNVVHKNGSFLTVQVRGIDGAATGIDLYTTFFSDGFFYESATVRHPLSRDAVLPLGEISFEGRMMPAPADPVALLTISYGPGFMTPDPSFRHEPGPEVHDRFDDWFGSLFRQRRDWRTLNAQAATESVHSGFADWVARQVPPGSRVVDVGCGGGADAAHLAAAGHHVLGLDYALPGPQKLRREENLAWESVNLYDFRDALATGALLARDAGRPQVLYARDLLESLAPEGRESFWQLAGMALRRGGNLYLEGEAAAPHIAHAYWRKRGARIWPLSPGAVAEAAEAAGGTVTLQAGVLAATQSFAAGGPPQRWRMVINFPARTELSA
jgi:hypothetical protein